MATYTGNAGAIKIDEGGTPTALAEVTGYSIESSTAAIDNTSMGDSSRTFTTGLESFSGTADVLYDDTHHATFTALRGGSGAGPVTLELFPNGTTSGERKISGEVIITGYSMTGSLDSMITASISFQGTGDLTMTGTAA